MTKIFDKGNHHEWEWLDTADVMQLLHVSYNTVLNLRNRGILPYSRLGHKLYFRRGDIHHILERNIVMEDGHIDSTGELRIEDLLGCGGHNRTVALVQKK